MLEQWAKAATEMAGAGDVEEKVISLASAPRRLEKESRKAAKTYFKAKEKDRKEKAILEKGSTYLEMEIRGREKAKAIRALVSTVER